MITTLRRQTKRTSLLALLAAALMICTGCVRSGVGVVIEPDDTGTVDISVGINERYVDTIKAQAGGVDPFEGQTTETLTDGSDSYICIVESKSFTDLDELETILLDAEFNFAALEGESSDSDVFDDSYDYLHDLGEADNDVWISADGEEIPVAEDDKTDDEETESYKIFKSAEVSHASNFLGDTYQFTVTTMPHEMNTDDLGMLGISGDNLFKVVVSVTMPGAVTAEGAEINENTATFTISDLETEQTLTAESSSTNVTGIIAVVVAALALVVILVLFFSRRKPKQNHEFE